MKKQKKSHFIVSITKFTKAKLSFKIPLESFKVIFAKISQNFIKSHLKFCLISQISVHSVWHVCISEYFTSFLGRQFHDVGVAECNVRSLMTNFS